MAINPFLTKQTKGVPRYMAAPGRAVKPVFRNGPLYRPRVWLRPGGGGTSAWHELQQRQQPNPPDTFIDLGNLREIRPGPWGFNSIRIGASAQKPLIGPATADWRTTDFTVVLVWRRWQAGGAAQTIIDKRTVTTSPQIEWRITFVPGSNTIDFLSYDNVLIGGGTYAGGCPAVGAWTITAGVRRGTGTASGVMKLWQNGVLGVNGTATTVGAASTARLCLGGNANDAAEDASVELAFLAILPIGLPDQMVAKLSLDPMYLWRDPIATQAIGVAASGGGARSRGLIIQ